MYLTGASSYVHSADYPSTEAFYPGPCPLDSGICTCTCTGGYLISACTCLARYSILRVARRKEGIDFAKEYKSSIFFLPRPHFHPICHRPRCAASDGSVVFSKNQRQQTHQQAHGRRCWVRSVVALLVRVASYSGVTRIPRGHNPKQVLNPNPEGPVCWPNQRRRPRRPPRSLTLWDYAQVLKQRAGNTTHMHTAHNSQAIK